MTTLNFVVNLEKMVGKGRPRFVRQGGFVRTYTPPETKNAERKIASVCKSAMDVCSVGVFKGSVKLDVEAGYPIPKSTSKRLKQQMLDDEVRPTVKPDADNVLKLVADALNGVMYKDDNQIVMMSFEKRYTDTKPYLRISVSDEVQNAPDQIFF